MLFWTDSSKHHKMFGENSLREFETNYVSKITYNKKSSEVKNQPPSQNLIKNG